MTIKHIELMEYSNMSV